MSTCWRCVRQEGGKFVVYKYRTDGLLKNSDGRFFKNKVVSVDTYFDNRKDAERYCNQFNLNNDIIYYNTKQI